MSLAVTHTFVSALADVPADQAAGKVLPSHWNDGHVVSGTVAIGDITGLGTDVATFLATPSSANLAAALTDEVGSGKVVFSAGTLAITSGKTWTVSNTITVTGTDGTSFAFPSTSDTVAVLGIAQNFTVAQTMLRAGIGATSGDGLVLSNTTAAAAGAQQWSPRLHWNGRGWSTNSGGASMAVDWVAENVPVQGAAAPTSNLSFSSSINGGAYTERFQISSAGAIQVTGTLNAGSLISANGWYSFAQGSNGGISLSMGSGHRITWVSGTSSGGGAAGDTFLKRGGAAATIQQGDDNAASPVAQTLQAQGSRSGTDSDVGGANYAIRSGAGTGTGTLSRLNLQSPIAVASGTSAQTQTTGLAIHNGTAVSTGYTVAALPAAPLTGARAHVTDSNAASYTAGIGAVVAAGGATIVPVFYDGTNWRIG